MDPDACLDRIAYDRDAGSLHGVLDGLVDLREWLSKGGFRPAVDTPARESAWSAYLNWSAS